MAKARIERLLDRLDLVLKLTLSGRGNKLSKPDRSKQRGDAYALEIAPALRAAQAAGGGGQTYGALAAALNDLGIATMSWRRWTASSISALLKHFEPVEDSSFRTA